MSHDDTDPRRLFPAANTVSPSTGQNFDRGAAAVVVSPSTLSSDGAEAGSGAENLNVPPPHMMSDVVELNVGGCKFTASRATLCRVRGSYLESMFSGRHAVAASLSSDDGSVFIDRDGSHFRHILNFLRSGSVITLPATDVEKEELAAEADFYCLDSLVKVIRMPKVDVAECLPEETLMQWEQESKLRSAFLKGTFPSDCPFLGLIPFFCPDNGFKSLPLTFDPDSPNQKNKSYLFIDDLRKNPKPKEGGTRLPVTVKTVEEFRTNFNREWPNVLHRLEDILLQEPVIVAGGAVLRALTESKGVTRTGDWWHGSSDINLFLYCRDREEANRIARRIFYALSWDNEIWVVIRCRGVINIHHMVNEVAETRVQIVLRLYESPTEVLIGFDVDCCCCAFNGREVWVSPRCASALQSGVNVLNPLHAWPNRASYELRLAKYAGRGYAVSVPGIDIRRIDYTWIHQSDLVDLKGMARLVKVVSEMDSAPIHKHLSRRRRNQGLAAIERPRLTREVATLREAVLNDESADERLILMRDVDFWNAYDAATDVIVPSVYPGPQYWNGAYGNEEFPLSHDSRNQAWEEILDAGENENRPASLERCLVDAWDTDKRSREYLNGGMDQYDLSSIYYSHAYLYKE